MNLKKVVEELRLAHEEVTPMLKQQKDIERKLIKEDESELVREFAKLIFPFEKKKEIHGEQALLLFVFNSSGKTLISPETYLKTNGEVVYQVFDEQQYRAHRPDAHILDGYNIISLEEFLETVPFYSIIDFFNERPAVLYENVEEAVDKNIARRDFIKLAKAEFKK